MATQNLVLVDAPPDWRTRFLAVITNPDIAMILMMIGIYGLMFEFMSPGALYPGIIGAICLITGFYALAALPVSYAGAALILLGLGLMAAEAVTASFGILGLGGLAAFILGSAILIDTDMPQFRIGWPAIGSMAVMSLAMTLLFTRLAFTSQRRRIVSGREELIGTTATVLDWAGGTGHVFVHGERWKAAGAGDVPIGSLVRVTGLDGLTLHITESETLPAGGERELGEG